MQILPNLSAAESPNLFSFFSTFPAFICKKRKAKMKSPMKKKIQDWKYVLVLLAIFGNAHINV